MSCFARARCPSLPLTEKPPWSLSEVILDPDSVSINFIELPFLPITKPMRSFGTATKSQVSPVILPRRLSLVAPHLRHRHVFFINISQQADGEQREKIFYSSYFCDISISSPFLYRGEWEWVWEGEGEGFSGAKVNKKTLIDISEPAICYEYWSEDSLMQQLLLKHLNVNVRCNKNVLAQLDDCIEGLLRLEPNVITYRTL